MSAREYFKPYIDNLITVLRSRKVELYNANTDDLRLRQPVIDDVLQQQEHEEKQGRERPKSYEALLHDVVLWHFTKGKRVSRVESPLDAAFWVATVDFRFLAFDSHKLRSTSEHIPICVHPTVLVQMLQFWVPRSPESEAALLNSLRPMLPREFDVESERTTISILRSLSRFENIDDLNDEVITSTLMNQALRQRLASETDVEAQINLVREEIIAKAEEYRSQLSDQQQKNVDLDEQLKRQYSEKIELEDKLEQELHRGQGLEARLSQLESQAKQAEAEISARKKTHEGMRQQQQVIAEKETRVWMAVSSTIAVLIFARFLLFITKPVLDNWNTIEPLSWLASIALAIFLLLTDVTQPSVKVFMA